MCFCLQGISSALVEITNRCPTCVEFKLRLEAFDPKAGALSGDLIVDPFCGKIDPGDTQLVKFQYEAGLSPEIFEGPVSIIVCPIQDGDVESVVNSASEFSGDEVLIAEHPPRCRKFML